MTDQTYPTELCVFFGSDMDPSIEPEIFTIPSASAMAAFAQGNDVADGYMGATFVNHANYRVDKDGCIREGKAPAKATPGNTRFVIWGEKPETGDRPAKYEFEDAQSAQAFEDAVNARVGWTQANFVPDGSFRAYRDVEHVVDEADPIVGAALERLVDEDEVPVDVHDPVFINPNGEFVQEHWVPGDPVLNVGATDTRDAPKRRGPGG